ncbi:hypothetical protein [Staphylococcus caeli]|uniref:hypothetical protein n=1 Tax=Staphylococcus caeli TaxID=2201815 RepID=UPI003F5715EB
MLSNKAEDFLLKLRIELLFRGKDEADINAIEEELRDHITTAESNGDNIDELLNTPIKTYADTFSKELKLTQGIYKYIGYIISFMLLMAIIPRMLDNSFQLTLALILYIIFIFVGSLFATLFLVKKILLKWGDSKITYTIAGCVSVITFGIFILCEFLVRHHPILTLWRPSENVNFIIGITLLVVTIIACFLLKQKYFAFIILLISLPNLIGKLFVGGDYTNKNFLLVSSIILIVISWGFIITLLVQYWRDKKSNNSTD